MNRAPACGLLTQPRPHHVRTGLPCATGPADSPSECVLKSEQGGSDWFTQKSVSCVPSTGTTFPVQWNQASTGAATRSSRCLTQHGMNALRHAQPPAPQVAELASGPNPSWSGPFLHTGPELRPARTDAGNLVARRRKASSLPLRPQPARAPSLMAQHHASDGPRVPNNEDHPRESASSAAFRWEWRSTALELVPVRRFLEYSTGLTHCAKRRRPHRGWRSQPLPPLVRSRAGPVSRLSLPLLPLTADLLCKRS